METATLCTSVFKTPSKPITPSQARSHSAKRSRANYSRTTTPDRFVPSRAVNRISVSQHLLSSRSAKKRQGDSPTSSVNPAKAESNKIYKESLSATFGVDLNSRVLDFGVKRLQRTDDLLFDGAGGSRSSQCTPSSAKRRKLFRPVSRTADRVLDAPEIVDDFYINTLDWGHSNSLAVALGNTLYIWKSDTGTIKQLCSTHFPENYITSVKWGPSGQYLAVGTNDSDLQLWNVEKGKMVRSSQSHLSRVSSLAWNGSMLCSGSKSGEIHQHDVRSRDMHVTTLTGHTQEVCGLKWSPNGRYLASGSNDCVVNIWDSTNAHAFSHPRHRLTDHKAAVKALAWCPWQSGVLASGGGTADKNVHFWNATSGQRMDTIATESQISGLLWNEEHREILVAQGFPRNQMTLYHYPSLQRVTDLRGHEGRILHVTGSPDGSTVASVGADETLRLWKCFSSTSRSDGDSSSTPHRTKKPVCTLDNSLLPNSSIFSMLR